ncbi:MAG TPA: PAS domain S-box protein [Thermoanaerobaculia bacterium]
MAIEVGTDIDPLLEDSSLAIAVLTALPVQVALLDAAGTITAVNRTWREGAALCAGGPETPHSLCEGINYLEACAHSAAAGDESAEAARQGLAGVLRGELGFFTLEYPYPQPGRDAWFLLYAAPLPAPPGGAVVAHVDITGRKGIEHEVAKREELHRLILESTSELISTHTSDSTFVFASGACRNLLGYEPEELIGRAALDFVHPDDLHHVRHIHERLLTTSIYETLTNRMRRRDGRYVWVESNIRVILSGGESAGYRVAVTRDVTERKEAEAQQAELRRALERAAYEWRSTFDAIQLPILLLGLDGRLRRLNRAASELLGRDYREVIGRTVGEIGSGQPWDAVAALTSRIIEGCPAEVCEARDEKGSRTWEVAASISAQSDEEDAKVIVQVRDLTETVRLQESLRRSETMAVLGSVVGGVAHEVRNPLFGMSSVLDAFENRFGDCPEFRPYLPLLRSELRRMTDLMQALLDYGKPPQFEMAAGDPIVAVEGALALCRQLAGRCGVSLRVEAAAARPPASFDPQQLAQALKNVVENAVQHSPEGSAVMIEAAGFAAEGAPWVRLSVLDQGSGFSPADLPRVLDPFFTRRKGGTGLGLSIVSRIVEAHGGRLRVSNHPAGGAQVDIELPALRSTEAF